MILGEKRQFALWFKGNEQFNKAVRLIMQVFGEEEEELGVQYGDREIVTIDTPHAPDEKTQKMVDAGYKIVLGVVTVVCDGKPKPIETEQLLRGIDPSDLKRMRNKTIAAFKNTYPGVPVPPMHTIDQIIADERMANIVENAH